MRAPAVMAAPTPPHGFNKNGPAAPSFQPMHGGLPAHLQSFAMPGLGLAHGVHPNAIHGGSHALAGVPAGWEVRTRGVVTQVNPSRNPSRSVGKLFVVSAGALPKGPI
jgi:hypothetical protein